MSVNISNDPRRIGYPVRLSLYETPPPYELSIEEFETYALDRLSILKAIETAQIRNNLKTKEKKYNSNLLEHIKAHMPLGRSELFKNNDSIKVRNELRKMLYEERKKDHISHFILRLAFCRTPDLRNWFVKLETELFKIRLSDTAGADEQDKLLQKANFGGTVFQLGANKNLTPAQRLIEAQVERDLKALSGSTPEFAKQIYYKVPFEKVPEQVSHRQVVVKTGFAYVPQSLQTSLLVNAFRERLTLSLEATAKALPRMEEDDRLLPVLTSLSKQHLSTTTANFEESAGAKFVASDIENLANTHMPLCMRNLHNSLRQNAHLRHFGRLQYGLFLKGIGLPYEESLNFWRKAFHKMTDEQFQKGGHPYNIRHSYGLEGKRTNYAPYSCVKIITSNAPSAGDHHGCPFKHFSNDNLRPLVTNALSSSSLNPSLVTSSTNDILTLTKNNHYQVACTKFFEFTRGASLKAEAGVVDGDNNLIETIEHPNQYFELSYRGLKRGQSSSSSAMNIDGDGDDKMDIDR